MSKPAAKPSACLARVRVGFSTTALTAAILDALVETGLYGRSRHTAAERLVCEGIQRRINPKLTIKAE